MTRKTLADMEESVNSAARDFLTHTITINGTAVRVQGDYGDGTIASAGSYGIRQEIELMILKADWPTYPARSDVYLLPRVAGVRFKPKNAENAPDGAHWIVNLEKFGI